MCICVYVRMLFIRIKTFFFPLMFSHPTRQSLSPSVSLSFTNAHERAFFLCPDQKSLWK